MLCDSLDIEFAIGEDETIYTLQVRPLMIDGSVIDHRNDQHIKDNLVAIEKSIKSIKDRDNKLYGENDMGVMADWNPAEIIGVAPSPLATELYQTSNHSVWAEQRHEAGCRI